MIKTNNFDKVATDVLKAIKDINYNKESKKEKYKSDVLLLLGETLESEEKYLEVTEFLKNYDINHKIEHNLPEDDKKKNVNFSDVKFDIISAIGGIKYDDSYETLCKSNILLNIFMMLESREYFKEVRDALIRNSSYKKQKSQALLLGQ